MTTPEERHEAKQQADEAFEHAQEIQKRSLTIAERWRKSQRDNNFRQMLRQLGGTTDAS